MTKTIRLLLVTIAAVAFAVSGRVNDGLLSAEDLGQEPQQVDEVALALRNPGSHPRVGLPDFLFTDNNPEMAAHAKTVADVLWNDIDFEREYYMIPRASSANVPVARHDVLPAAQWAELGADLVLVGEARQGGRNLVIELRLISVRGDTPGRQYFGKRYQCGMQTARGPRDCAHQIADDFHKDNRNLDGVARTKLAFTSDRDGTRQAGRPATAIGKEIYISDYDGENEIRLTTNRSLNISPSWSPNGNLIAYTSYTSGFPDIYVANIAQPGRGLQRPAGGNDRMQNQSSAWSPDGSKLAFMSNRSGNNDIWVVDRDGDNLRNLTNYPNAIDGTPAWSPDGSQIAFTSDRASRGRPQLYVMTVASGVANRLASERIDRPTWSSLNFIAFTVETPGGQDIGIYDFSNPGVRIITDGLGKNESPSISPNGRHIAFMTTRWGRQHIAVVDRTGDMTRLRRITENGNNTYPNWQPITGR